MPAPSPAPVQVSFDDVVLPTYAPAAPDRNPMFLEKRVYQGSSGKVYPLPFTDRVAETPAPRAWKAVHLENAFIRVMILPELGGRIHVGHDKTNGYDFFYRQDVIKPALVGLAGPWISGGVEFNWPQHHRPSTFMPADAHVERHPDGAVTVWLSEHDPMARMKGMHGVTLYPDRAYIELRARVFNRTPHPQTFLWWANVATRVHERYQSFFPRDVTYVADHAKRAMSRFPRAEGHYYGVDYAKRGREGVPAADAPRQYAPPAGEYSPDDLSWYANIPVPTSYMAMGSAEDFFGGYDHAAEAGLVHVANHHISPGKKQWTWGNHPFGYAWDRNLTDADARGEHAPYIELMAGVYTDNQPDFSFLQPGETKTWSQFWYPIQKIGPAHQANLHAAVSLLVRDGRARLGVSPARAIDGAVVTLSRGAKELARFIRDLAPGAPLLEMVKLPRGVAETDLVLRVCDADGAELLAYAPKKITAGAVPPAATEPPLPGDIASTDELFVTGLHLDQYRHATRMPETYWSEALRRDPGDARCNLAMGKWHLRRGEWADAERHLSASIARQTLRNPNPADGEAHYQLGLVLRHLGNTTDAYAAFYKSTWNQAWAGAAYHALAELDCARGDFATALAHLDRVLVHAADNLRARALRVIALRKLGRDTEAAAALDATLALDPLDAWSLHLRDGAFPFDVQIRLDVAHDYARAGLFAEALALLDTAPAPAASGNPADLGAAPLLAYTAAWIAGLVGDAASRRRHLANARKASPDYCFPARLEEIHVLEAARAADPRDGRAALYLGHLLYDRRRHAEAIACWRDATRLDPKNAVAWRCLGLGAFNILKKPALARAAYEKAFPAAPADARLCYERDQLWKRLGIAPAKRLRELEKHAALIAARDDLTVEYCALLNQTGAPERARAIVAARKFQPWEGGEGQALGQHVRTHVLLARRALAAGDAAQAVEFARAALAAPENLGEAKHLLANQSDIQLLLGDALAAAGRADEARAAWTAAAEARGDFQAMSVKNFSEMTYFSALALRRLGRSRAAEKLLRELLAHARALAKTEAKIDYFATSLPTMLLFEADLQTVQTDTARFLEAQALLGLGKRAAARAKLKAVLASDPAHALAADLAASI